MPPRSSSPISRSWAYGFFYHVTLYRNLKNIASVGLIPSTGGIASGLEGLIKHSKNKVFVSTWAGVRFWAESAIDLSNEIIIQEDPDADRNLAVNGGIVPVLLRIVADEAGCVKADMEGWRDSCAEAFETKGIQNIAAIDLFIGKSKWSTPWNPLLGLERKDSKIDLELAVHKSGRNRGMVLDLDENPLFPKGLPDTSDWCRA